MAYYFLFSSAAERTTQSKLPLLPVCVCVCVCATCCFGRKYCCACACCDHAGGQEERSMDGLVQNNTWGRASPAPCLRSKRRGQRREADGVWPAQTVNIHTCKQSRRRPKGRGDNEQPSGLWKRSVEIAGKQTLQHLPYGEEALGEDEGEEEELSGGEPYGHGHSARQHNSGQARGA